MSDREEALDFIYKGWRDGRQNRRDVRTERGQNTMASRINKAKVVQEVDLPLLKQM